MQICHPPVRGRCAAPGCGPAVATPPVGVATGKIRRHDQRQSGRRAPSAREPPARMSLVKEPPAYRAFRTALAVGVALLGSGCDLSHAPVLDPKGPIALAERDLLFTALILMLIVVIPVFAHGVLVCLALSRVQQQRPATRRTGPIPLRIDAVVWLVPAADRHRRSGALRLELYAPARSLQAAPTPPTSRSRSRWSRRTGNGCSSIPQQGIAVVNELVFPSGRPLSLRLTSDTVMNSFYIPASAGQIYAMAGMQTRLQSAGRRARAVRGPQHAVQRPRLRRPAFRRRSPRSPADFDAWVAKVKAIAATSSMPPAYARTRHAAARRHPVTYYSAVAPGLFDDDHRQIHAASRRSATSTCRPIGRRGEPTMLGRLTIDALPFYSAIAFGGALVTCSAALAVVARHHLVRLVALLCGREWLTSVDHKRIGIMYVMLALIMLLRGFIDALMMRAQQAIARQLRRLSAARAFRPDLHLARHHHDLLHGDAVSDRPDQYRRSAADRRARRRLSRS